MATYSSPSGASIRTYTRLQGAAFGITDSALETALAAVVAQGEDRTFARIGDAYETDSSLTDRQVRLLQAAVSHRIGAVYLWELLVDKTGGTHEPLLTEESDAIRALLEDNEARAEEYEGLLQGAAQQVDSKPFALPAIGASTFGYSSSSGDRLPSERNRLVDDSDDVSAWDTDNG